MSAARDATPPWPERARDALRPGARVGGHVVERALGAGAMGGVYLARRPGVEAPRALKVVHADGRPDRLERFAREARTLARLPPHAGVVAVHDFGVDGDLAWCALDLVEGEDLERALARGPLDVARAARVGAGVARALAHLHAHGVVHRDLKPANVLLRAADGAPVLVDLGIARDEAEARMTASQALLGTPAYMAPEQITGEARAVGPPADVFALGALLFELLTGRRAFAGETFPELAARITGAAPPPPSRERAGVPGDLDAVVLACLDKDPAARPSAGAVAAALEALARGARGELPGRRSPRRRAAARAAALAGAVALLAGGVVVAAGEARRREARGALAAGQALVEGAVLPWVAGVAGVASGAPRPDPSAVAAAGVALAAARPALAGDELAAAEAALGWLGAAARAAGGDLAGASARGPPDAALEALAALARGERAAALAAAERAGRGGDATAAAVRAAVRAELEPARLLEELAAAGAAAPPPAVVARALAARTAERVRQAAAGLELEPAAADLERLAARADALGCGDGPVAAAKALAMEEVLAPAVGRAVEDTVQRVERDPTGAAELVRRVAAFAAAPPAVRPGPRLTAALVPLVEAPLAAWRAAPPGSPAAWTRLRQVAAAEAALGPALRRPTPPAVRDAVLTLLRTDLEGAVAGQGAELLLVVLRGAFPWSLRELPEPPLAPLDALAGASPRSRAAQVARALLGVDRQRGRSRRGTIAALEAALAAPDPDLAPAYEAEALLRLGELLAEEARGLARGRRAAEGPALAARARAALEAAGGRFLRTKELVFAEAEAAATAATLLGDGEGALRAWAGAADELLRRAAGAGPSLTTAEAERQAALAALVARGRVLDGLGRHDQAGVALREALALAEAHQLAPWAPRAALCDHLVAAGRLAEARAALDPARDRVDQDVAVARAAARLLAAEGDRDGARAAVERALRRFRGDDELEAVRDGLGGAPPR